MSPRAALWWRLLQGALLLAPALWILFVISGTYVEYPIFDQVGTLLPFLEKVFAGEVRLADFFAPDGWEGAHITAVPKLIFAALALPSHWTIHLELFVSLALALATFAMLLALAGGWRAPTGGFVGAALLSLFCFSMAQARNWFFGYALMYFLVNALVAAAVLLLYDASRRDVRRRVMAAITLCAAATFSMAQGALSWFALLPLVAVVAARSGRRREVIGAWSVATVLTWSLLLWRLPAQSSPGRVIAQLREAPLPVVDNVLRFLGTHFVYAVPLLDVGESSAIRAATIAGALALLAFLLAGEYLRRRAPAAERRRVAAWFSLGCFSILYAGALTAGRWFYPGYSDMLFGRFNFSVSMYATTLVLFPAALVELVLMAATHTGQVAGRVVWKWRVARVGTLFLLAWLIASFAVGVAATVRAGGLAHSQRDCMTLARYLDKQNTCSEKPWAAKDEQSLLDTLHRLGLRHIEPQVAFAPAASAAVGHVEGFHVVTPPVRQFIPPRMTYASPSHEDQVVLRGAVEPGIGRTVALSAANRATVFALGAAGGAGAWEVEFPIDLLAEGPSLLHAWLYDPARREFRRIDELVTVVRRGVKAETIAIYARSPRQGS